MENTTAAQKIFFSYSRSDGEECAFKLANDLRAAGANVWVDQQDIDPGKNWDIEIEAALNAADCVLFVATEKSVVSNNVQNELGYALEENKKVIPVVFHQCKIPFRLSRLQRIDFTTDYEAAFGRLLKALGLKANTTTQQDVANTKEQTRPPVSEDKLVEKVPVQKQIVEPFADRPKQEETVKSSPTIAGAKNTDIHDNASSTVLVEQSKTGSRKTLFWGLGIAATAVLAFFIFRSTSGNTNEKNNKDSSMVLSKTTDTTKYVSTYKDSTKQSVAETPASVDKTEEKNQNTKPANNPVDDAADKQKKFESYKQSGMNNFNAKNYPAAIDDFVNALKIQQDAEVCFYTGRSYGFADDYRSAIKYYTIAIELAPDKAGYWGSRGLAYRNNNEYAASLQDFDKAISLSPRDGQVYNNRGTVKQAMNDMSGACQDFSTAQQLGDAGGTRNYQSYCQPKTPSTGIKIRTDRLKVQKYEMVKPKY